MTDKKMLSFEQICPFVRHIHLDRIEPDMHMTRVKAYDHRIFYIYGGKGYILINGEKYGVSKGCLLFWQPGTEYFIYSDAVDNLFFFGVNFDFTIAGRDANYPIPPSKAEDFDESKILERVVFSDMEALNQPVYLTNFQTIESVLMEMKNEYTAKKKFFTQKMSGMLLSVLGDIARYASSSGASAEDMCDTVDRILKHIHDNYDQPLTNRDIGARFNFHANYINKLMVQHTGTSLHQYLVNYRISRAIHLMQTTGRSLSEIAFSVGFKDVNYFSKAFKNKTGESPRNFKAHSWGPV